MAGAIIPDEDEPKKEISAIDPTIDRITNMLCAMFANEPVELYVCALLKSACIVRQKIKNVETNNRIDYLYSRWSI